MTYYEGGIPYFISEGSLVVTAFGAVGEDITGNFEADLFTGQVLKQLRNGRFNVHRLPNNTF